MARPSRYSTDFRVRVVPSRGGHAGAVGKAPAGASKPTQHRQLGARGQLDTITG
jgi:hypothetical protein